MDGKRTMELVGNRVSFDVAEDESLSFWAEKSKEQRLEEMERLRRLIWTHILGKYPDKMQKVGQVVKISTLDE
jgi:hypothetical protein